MGVLSWSEIGERLDAERKRSEDIRRSAWAWKQRCLDAEQRCARVGQLAHQWPKPGMELLELREQNLRLRQERDELKSRGLEKGKAAVRHLSNEMEHLQDKLEDERVKSYGLWADLQKARQERDEAIADRQSIENLEHSLDQANLTIISLREELEKSLDELKQSQESSQLLQRETDIILSKLAASELREKNLKASIKGALFHLGKAYSCLPSLGTDQ